MTRADKPRRPQRWAARLALCAGLAAAWPAAHAYTVGLTPGTSAGLNTQGWPASVVVLDEAALRWDFSNGNDTTKDVGGFVGGLNVLRATLEPAGGALVDSTVVDIVKNPLVKRTTRAFVNVQAPVQQLSLDLTGDNTLVSFQSAGGVSLASPYLQDLAGGGALAIENLRVDMRQGLIYGKVSGKSASSAEVVVDENLALFSFGAASGAKGFGDANYAASVWGLGGQGGSAIAPDLARLAADGWQVEATTATTIAAKGQLALSAVRMTDNGFQVFANHLGLIEGYTGYTTLAGINQTTEGLGTMQVGLAVRLRDNLALNQPQVFDLPPVRLVPEPSTYALMGLGLMGLTWARRRQRQAVIR